MTRSPDIADPALPNIWGPGQLLGFSGLDGPVEWFSQLVLHTAAQSGDFLVRLPFGASINHHLPSDTRVDLVLSDALTATTPAGRFAATFADSTTLIGLRPDAAGMEVDHQPIHRPIQSIRTENNITLFAGVRDRQWILFTLSADAADQAEQAAQQAYARDIDQILAQRSAFVRGFTPPADLSISDRQLLGKALSVMKVNTLSPCGSIPHLWSTPDRWPHRFMWLWDTAFHAVAMARVDPQAAAQVLLAMLERTGPEGFLQLTISPDDRPQTQVTQPPILAWAAAKVLQAGAGLDFARTAEPLLQRYLDWDRLNRDRNGNDLYEWFTHDNPLCRSGESGMDNSPRFDAPEPLDAVDFSSFLANDYAALAQIAQATGNTALQETAQAHARRISQAVNLHLWDADRRFYFDRTLEGRLIPIKASSGFLPLFAGIPTPDHARQLAAHLSNPATFGAPLPVPSVSLDEGTFCKDMWRGPTWLNTNYLIYEGLLKYNFHAEAAALRSKTLSSVTRWYRASGCLFEFYDALDLTPPPLLDRKQRLASGKGIAPISDYHWTAAVIALMLLE